MKKKEKGGKTEGIVESSPNTEINKDIPQVLDQGTKQV